ncbi:MAG TPA: hypothetical protein VEL28_05820 [Candidatus Binatia bacterium]|nr:hypothetical protein [Candidatus Binatia bacterium]
MRPSFRSLFLRALAAGLLAVAMPATSPAQTCGDVSGDDSVLASDALLVLKKAVGQDVELTCTGACAELEARVAQLEAILANFSIAGDTVVLTGANLQIVSGSGTTGGEPNGTGNLIVGYNEGVGGQERSGSHNIVVGREHEYTSFGGIVAGNGNTIEAAEASVLGGKQNVASGTASSVSGGNQNEASHTYASVAGGFLNVASGQHATVGGGCENVANATFAHVSGGQQNTASEDWATVTGGLSNESTGFHDWRGGSMFFSTQ